MYTIDGAATVVFERPADYVYYPWQQRLSSRFTLSNFCSRIFTPDLQHKMIRVKRIRLDLDTRGLSSWAEIDAVALRGIQFLEWSVTNHKV